jgi:CTP-dependent riboflavin kinase
MTRKENTFIHINILYLFNKIYTSETGKTRSSVKCVLSLKSRLRAVHGLLALLYILSLKESSWDIKVKENTWIESSITTLLIIFKFFLDTLTLTFTLLAGLGDSFYYLANLEYFLYKKWGMELTPYQGSACISLTNLEVSLWSDNNKHVVKHVNGVATTNTKYLIIVWARRVTLL